MLDLLLAASLGASLVAISTIAAARWGHVIGGVLSAFPLIVGPVLLVAAERHGTAFAARTAAATLLGLIALSGFALVYARAARRLGWRSSVALAWLVAAALGALAARAETGLLGGLVAAAASLAFALGMLGGMAAFVLFCALIGLLVEPAGVAAAFVLATAAAVLVQAGLGRQVASRAVVGA